MAERKDGKKLQILVSPSQVHGSKNPDYMMISLGADKAIPELGAEPSRNGFCKLSVPSCDVHGAYTKNGNPAYIVNLTRKQYNVTWLKMEYDPESGKPFGMRDGPPVTYDRRRESAETVVARWQASFGFSRIRGEQISEKNGRNGRPYPESGVPETAHGTALDESFYADDEVFC